MNIVCTGIVKNPESDNHIVNLRIEKSGLEILNESVYCKIQFTPDLDIGDEPYTNMYSKRQREQLLDFIQSIPVNL